MRNWARCTRRGRQPRGSRTSRSAASIAAASRSLLLVSAKRSTVAPIECFSVIQYGSYSDNGLYDPSPRERQPGSASGMTTSYGESSPRSTSCHAAVFLQVNAGHGWKGVHPVLAISCCCSSSHANNLARAGRFQCRTGSRPCSPPSPSAGIVFAYLGFEQADQLPAEIKNPPRTCPARSSPRSVAWVLHSNIIILSSCLWQFAFIGANRTA